MIERMRFDIKFSLLLWRVEITKRKVFKTLVFCNMRCFIMYIVTAVSVLFFNSHGLARENIAPFNSLGTHVWTITLKRASIRARIEWVFLDVAEVFVG